MRFRSAAIGVIALLAGCIAVEASSPTMASPVAGRAGLSLKRSAAGAEEDVSLDRRALAALRQTGRQPFRLSAFPTAPGARADLVLRRFDAATSDARIRITGEAGDTFRPIPEIAHFEGHIDGDPDSRVYVAALADGLVSWIRGSNGMTTYVGPVHGGRYVVREGSAPRPSEWRCFADETPAAVPAPLVAVTADAKREPAPAPQITGFQKAGLILETDQELLADFSGDVEAMSAYLLTLSAQFNLIYERDLSFHFTVSEIHVWNVADPWDGPSPNEQLLQLGDWYHANRPIGTYPRGAAFLLSGRTVIGGVAYLPSVCLDDFAVAGGHWGGSYGVTQLYTDWPAQQWDLFSMLHEIGHICGSAHTHCYAPPIDMCWSGDAGCYSGPTSVPPGGGTIMSYCYLLPGGDANVNLVFHPRCINEQLLPYIQAASCTTAVATFPDVPTSNPFFHFVETIFQLGITGGCSGGNYCPGNPVTREQMAVFLLKAKYGAAHVPPACQGTFGDVPCSSPFAPWIEELASLGITGGCGNGNYCPGNTVTRQQMAPFLLKTLYGSSFVPDTCTGIFTDVPCAPGVGFDDFIEELYGLGITGGCASSPLRYCPTNPNTRAQMAVFLVKTFGLVW
jgi:hypothetical protein